MAYVAIDKEGNEAIYSTKPFRGINKVKPITEFWALPTIGSSRIALSKGSIKKLIGKDLTWEDEPVKI